MTHSKSIKTNALYLFFIFSGFLFFLAGCDSSEVKYSHNTDSIALTTVRGKSMNTRYIYNDSMSFVETSVINGTSEEVNKDESKKSGAYRIRSGYMLDVGSKFRSGFVSSDGKTKVLASVPDNEENEISLSIAFQRSSDLTNSSLNGDYHMNRMTWGGGGVSFSLSKATVSFDGKSKINTGSEVLHYRVSDDGTLRLGDSAQMTGMLGMGGGIFFSSVKDDRGNSYDFSLGIKKSSGLGTASLKGKYYACEIAKSPQKVYTQKSNFTFDGAGSFSEKNADDEEQAEISGSYSVSDDGSITMDNGTGSITSDGSFFILMVERAGDWRYIIARRI